MHNGDVTEIKFEKGIGTIKRVEYRDPMKNKGDQVSFHFTL